ncbi:hypothetical protein P7K49_025708 [Saguinus oedipus]|uniref:Uncharacterized protein n=1 Tax=Saguinus oedipus TaxID=9490 RepID=A0ABQ9UHY2_SAGOE|nr:hypothetical protein P7K49_025708 [Saguinus oedipus]
MPSAQESGIHQMQSLTQILIQGDIEVFPKRSADEPSQTVESDMKRIPEEDDNDVLEERIHTGVHHDREAQLLQKAEMVLVLKKCGKRVGILPGCAPVDAFEGHVTY